MSNLNYERFLKEVEATAAAFDTLGKTELRLYVNTAESFYERFERLDLCENPEILGSSIEEQSAASEILFNATKNIMLGGNCDIILKGDENMPSILAPLFVKYGGEKIVEDVFGGGSYMVSATANAAADTADELRDMFLSMRLGHFNSILQRYSLNEYTAKKHTPEFFVAAVQKALEQKHTPEFFCGEDFVTELMLSAKPDLVDVGCEHLKKLRSLARHYNNALLLAENKFDRLLVQFDSILDDKDIRKQGTLWACDCDRVKNAACLMKMIYNMCNAPFITESHSEQINRINANGIQEAINKCNKFCDENL